MAQKPTPEFRAEAVRGSCHVKRAAIACSLIAT